MTSKMISFSICIPNYNYARYIGETIQSVLNQTYPHFEIVVVDNASTDNSVEVVKSFRDPRIKLFVNQYNVGFAPNLDRAAQRASNPYIIMLSSDDLMKPMALEVYADILARLPDPATPFLLVSSIDVIDSEGKLIGQMSRSSYYSIPPEHVMNFGANGTMVEVFSGLRVFKEVFPRMSVPGHFCTTLYSRATYDAVGGYSSMNFIGPDAHFAYKVLLQDARVYFVGAVLFQYRVHAANQLSSNRKAGTLKVPIDRYVFTLQYSDRELAQAGVARDQMARHLVREACLNDGLRELAAGARAQAFRLLMFAFASYPGLALRSFRSYVLMGLVMLGPVGALIARALIQVYKRIRGRMFFLSPSL